MVLIIKKTPLYMVCSLYGGQGWIRTNEDVVDGFTVRLTNVYMPLFIRPIAIEGCQKWQKSSSKSSSNFRI